MTLRVADLYSAEHIIGSTTIQPLMEKVTERTNGAVQFDYFPSEQVSKAKDIPSGIRAGTFDVGNLVYVESTNPLLSVSQLPGVFKDSETEAATKALFRFVQENDSVSSTFDQLEIEPLLCMSTTNFQLIVSKPNVDNLDAVRDNKVRAAGVVLPHTLDALGVTAVDVDINETYQALQQGVVDGVTLAIPSLKAYSFMETLDSAIINIDLGGYPVCYGIGNDQWQQLTSTQQEIVRDTAQEVMSSAAKAQIKQSKEDLKEWRKAGVHTYRLGESDKAALASLYKKGTADWVDEMRDQGVRNPSASVEQWRDLVAQERQG